ncbi:unnamed protein product, partial [Mesorhabditis spiculigera]
MTLHSLFLLFLAYGLSSAFCPKVCDDKTKDCKLDFQLHMRPNTVQKICGLIGMQMFVPEAMKDYVFPMSQKPKDYRVLNDQPDGGKFVHITGRDGKQHSFVIWPMHDKINGETWYSQSNLLAFDAVCVPRGSNVTGTYPVPPTANHREFVDEPATKKPSG